MKDETGLYADGYPSSSLPHSHPQQATHTSGFILNNQPCSSTAEPHLVIFTYPSTVDYLLSIAQVWGNPSQGAQFMTGFAQNMNCELCKTYTNIKGILGSTAIRCHSAQARGCLEQRASKMWRRMLTLHADGMCSFPQYVFLHIYHHVASWSVVFSQGLALKQVRVFLKQF